MRIGVISDTHIPVSSPRLPGALVDALRQCDIIIHAGDLVEMSVLDELGRISEVKAVHGNMDSAQLKRLLPPKLLLNVEGVNIGVIHGSGPSFSAVEKAIRAFKPLPDVIIFGHSHKPLIEHREGVLLFNPGSATDRMFGKNCTYGIIEIRDGQLMPEILNCCD